MGKGRLLKVRERQGESEITMEERKARSWRERQKEKIFAKMEQGYDKNVARARAKMLNRWREMTGVGPGETPDYSHP